MADVFMVYGRRDSGSSEQWGIASSGSWPRQVVHVHEDGCVTHETVTQSQLQSLLSKLARAGHKALSTQLFFDEDNGEFVSTHPDFTGGLKGAKYVLFAVPPDITSSIIKLDSLAREQGFQTLLKKEESWVSEQLRKSSYLVASDTSPMWALVIAELAMTHQWPLTAARSGMPDQPPSKAPDEWRTWLQDFFAMETIAQSQRELGWVSAKLINPSNPIEPIQKLPVDFLM